MTPFEKVIGAMKQVEMLVKDVQHLVLKPQTMWKGEIIWYSGRYKGVTAAASLEIYVLFKELGYSFTVSMYEGDVVVECPLKNGEITQVMKLRGFRKWENRERD